MAHKKQQQRRLTRAQAIEKAIDTSDPGDNVTIHQAICSDATVCCCTTLEIYIGGVPQRGPIGFRFLREEQSG